MTLKSVDSVLEFIHAAQPLPIEKVGLNSARGRHIAHDFYAPEELPGFDRSTVDGFAVRAEDVFGASENSPALLRLKGRCLMGKAPDMAVEPGEAMAISTGSMMPAGADCVVMVEYSRPVEKGSGGEDFVELTRSQAPGDNMVYADEDTPSARLLIKGGSRLRAAEIGALAALGQTGISVGGSPVVAIISTGDELVPVNQKPLPGQIRDVNAHSIRALAEDEDARVIELGICRDDETRLTEMIGDALRESDIVIVSGGSSAGARDHTLSAFSQIPETAILAHGVAISPGKPFILGRSLNKWMMGLPGHVSSALVCAHVFLRPLLRRLQGDRLDEPVPTVEATLTRSVASAQGRRDYIRCHLSKHDGEWFVTPIVSSSAVISGMIEANGLLVCPENLEGLAKGARCPVEII